MNFFRTLRITFLTWIILIIKEAARCFSALIKPAVASFVWLLAAFFAATYLYIAKDLGKLDYVTFNFSTFKLTDTTINYLFDIINKKEHLVIFLLIFVDITIEIYLYPKERKSIIYKAPLLGWLLFIAMLLFFAVTILHVLIPEGASILKANFWVYSLLLSLIYIRAYPYIRYEGSTRSQDITPTSVTIDNLNKVFNKAEREELVIMS